MKTALLLFTCMVIPTALAGQFTAVLVNPLVCDEAGKGESLPELRGHIQGLTAKADFSRDPYANCQVATLQKRLGDSRAENSFQNAIRLDPEEPAYDWLYAEYLRNVRGPGRPLFSAAEKHYFLALKKVRQRAALEKRPWDQIVERRVQRSLIALYQEDGVTALSRLPESDAVDSIPLAFVASLDRFARSTADLDREVDDVRDYTSEALFSESTVRKNRPLTRDELRSLIRTKLPLESLARVRFRHGDLPSIDVFYKYRQTPNAAVTNFFDPGTFDGLVLNSYGITAEKPFSAGRGFDVDLAGTFQETRQQGLIEFFPTATEEIRDYEGKTAVSRFIGPDKVILQFNYAYQAIHPEGVNEPDRDREFTGATLTYQLFRPQRFRTSPYERHFAIRSWDFLAGFLIDNEAFNAANSSGNTTVIRRDYFASIALKAMGRFDLTVQPTVLSSSSSSHIPASNSQYRTNVTLVYRRIDEDRRPLELPEIARPLNMASWEIVVAARQDIALHGLDAFENYKIGVESTWKLFTRPTRTTALVSAGYGFQRFYRLDKNQHIVDVSLKIGF